MNENLEKTYKKLKGQFDTEEPKIGHFERFEAKLKRIQVVETTVKKSKNYRVYVKFTAIAASVVMLFGVIFNSINFNTKGFELASVSPKMEETQDYFNTVIYSELKKISALKNENNAIIIEDAFVQLNHLEENYKKMTFDLEETSNSQEIIFAMINNYQQRITVLQNLLINLDEVKKFKNIEYENKTI